MKKHIIRLSALLIALTTFSSCQDIKDTFADYAGDGEIRYIGECKDLAVTPGWKRVIVSWNNNVDPIISKIKVRWSNDDMADSVLLERGTHEYSIPNLGNDTYQISVSSVDKDGNSSISNIIYGRPYTEEHEEVKSFTRIIAKQFFLGNHLIMLFSGWSDGIENAYLTYTKKDGKMGKLVLSKELTTAPIYELKDEIDTSKPITMYRTGKISSCPDLIEFSPIQLEKNESFTSDFKEFIRTKYGEGSKQMDINGNINPNWVANAETVEIDADMDSFEDLLNFPKLKKLILGKNRYLTDAGINDAVYGQYKIYQPVLSNEVLSILHRYQGLTVERYNKHYANLTKEPYIKEMGKAQMPNIVCYDLSKAKVAIMPEDEEGYNSHLEYLTDGKTSTCWKPLQQYSMTTYQITFSLNEEVNGSGIKIVQKAFDEYDDEQEITPQKVKVEIADNSGNFYEATHQEENYLGRTSGETILLPFAKGQQKVKYLRISIPSIYYHKFYAVTLAEIGLYK